MLKALGMQLEAVRTVLKNSACEVAVYADMGSGQHYTLVTLLSAAQGKEIAGRIAVDGLFAATSDFVGSFIHKGTLNLVFRYHYERRIVTSGEVYKAGFAKRKEMALSFLSALAETGVSGDVGCLLVSEENVNVENGRVYLNYFLNFKKLPQTGGSQMFYSGAAMFAFTILSWDYAQRYDGDAEQYPNELRLMQKKAERQGFRSFSQIIAFIRELPDELRGQRRGATRVFNLVDGAKRALAGNGTRAFMTLIVLVTLIYLGFQVGARISAGLLSRQNTYFSGLETIGEVYLGEEYY